MRNSLKNLYLNIYNSERETPQIVRFAKKYAPANASILDVGCGHGNNLRALMEAGFTVTGVDKSKDFVANNKLKGLPCFHLEEFKPKAKYDLILMANVIEHIPHSEVIDFLNNYLDLLKPNGHLILTTPFYSEVFYDEIDHVRPYNPLSFINYWREEKIEVQDEQRRHILELRDLWIKKTPHLLFRYREKYIRTHWRPILRAIELLSMLLFLGSFKLFGLKENWMAIFSHKARHQTK